MYYRYSIHAVQNVQIRLIYMLNLVPSIQHYILVSHLHFFHFYGPHVLCTNHILFIKHKMSVVQFSPHSEFTPKELFCYLKFVCVRV